MFVLVVGALGIGIWFFEKNTKDFSDKVRQAQQDLISSSKAIGYLAELRKTSREKSKPYLNVLYNVIPQKEELINFSQDIQFIAESENLEFGFSFTGETPQSGGNLGSAKFSITIRGNSLQNTLNFIKRLEESRYLNKISDISVNRSGGAIATTITGEVFYR